MNLIRNHPLASFLTIAFAWSWALWAVLLASGGVARIEDYTTETLLVIFVGAFGPTVAALIVTGAQGGWGGVRKLLGRLFIWRVDPRWYGILVLPFAMWYVTAQVVGAANGTFFTFTGDALLLVQALLAGLIGGPIAEEIGWRGWLLPHLQQRRQSVVRASVIVGVVWAAWHIPTFFLPGIALGSNETGMVAPMVRYLMFAIAMSIICGWVSNNTRGSLLIDMLLHAAFNASGSFILLYLQPDAFDLFGAQLPWVNMVLCWLVAAAIIVSLRVRRPAAPPTADPVLG